MSPRRLSISVRNEHMKAEKSIDAFQTAINVPVKHKMKAAKSSDVGATVINVRAKRTYEGGRRSDVHATINMKGADASMTRKV